MLLQRTKSNSCRIHPAEAAGENGSTVRFS